MAKRVKAGIIGCGDISQAYVSAAQQLEVLEIMACASRTRASADALAEKNGLTAMSVPELLAEESIEIVINLTTPQAHTEINLQALEAGKHVYCEKPFAVSREEGRQVLALAAEKGLRVGSAPDTFFGGALQTCRKLVDDGWIGRPVAGTALMCCHGHEHWHPNPGFYYLEGGGPLLDLGPYYLTALVHLLGPIRRVSALCGRAFEERQATSKGANGQVLPVEVDTHTAGTIEFCNGTILTLVMSFDVWKHSGHPIELHGTAGSMKVPDPNMFSGEISVCRAGQTEWQPVPLSHGYTDNMRSIGVADMAYAIQSGRPHRCNGEMAYHILDVMLAFEDSSRSGRHIEIESTCAQPAALPMDLPAGALDA